MLASLVMVVQWALPILAYLMRNSVPLSRLVGFGNDGVTSCFFTRILEFHC